MERLLQLGAVSNDPPVDRGVIHLHPTLLHEFFDMTGAQRIRYVPADPHQNDLWGEMAPLKLIAIVALPHDTVLPIEEEHTSKCLK
jgi:hypothetical protein